MATAGFPGIALRTPVGVAREIAAERVHQSILIRGEQYDKLKWR